METLTWISILFTLMIIVLVTLILYDTSPAFQYRFKHCFYVAHVSLVCLLSIPFIMFQPGNVENLPKAHRFVKLAAKVLGIKYDISGLEHLAGEDPCVIVCNHQSILDTLLMSTIWPRRCTGVCKRELLYAFPFGLGAWLCGVIFIDRSQGSKSIAQLEATAEVLRREKTNLWIFPEGTRHKGKELLPFKKGAFHIALQSKMPIVPVVISPYSFIDDENLTFGQGRLAVSVLAPIPTSEGQDVKALADKTWDLMNAEFLRLSNSVQSESTKRGI